MHFELRALILAAGFGTRLQPLTFQTPKCLMQIGGKPLLEKWLESLEELGCESALINTHYLSHKVDGFIKTYRRKDMLIETIYEPQLLGTAGTLLRNRNWFTNKTGLLIHADNATNANLKLFLKAHRERPKECLLTMLTFKTDNPRSCGIVETNSKGLMLDFHEKVDNPPCDIANGAVYLFDKCFLEWLEENSLAASDFSTEILPLLKGKVQTWLTTSDFLDIGTPESLQIAQDIFSGR